MKRSQNKKHLPLTRSELMVYQTLRGWFRVRPTAPTHTELAKLMGYGVNGRQRISSILRQLAAKGVVTITHARQHRNIKLHGRD